MKIVIKATYTFENLEALTAWLKEHKLSIEDTQELNPKLYAFGITEPGVYTATFVGDVNEPV